MIISGWILSVEGFIGINNYANFFLNFEIKFETKIDDGLNIINFYKSDFLNYILLIKSMKDYFFDKPEEIGEFFLFEKENIKHFIIKEGKVIESGYYR